MAWINTDPRARAALERGIPGRTFLLNILAEAKWHRGNAAALMGINRHTLTTRLFRAKITPEDIAVEKYRRIVAGSEKVAAPRLAALTCQASPIIGWAVYRVSAEKVTVLGIRSIDFLHQQVADSKTVSVHLQQEVAYRCAEAVNRDLSRNKFDRRFGREVSGGGR